MPEKKLPKVGTVVRFQAVRQAVPGKNDRAIAFAGQIIHWRQA